MVNTTHTNKTTIISKYIETGKTANTAATIQKRVEEKIVEKTKTKWKKALTTGNCICNSQLINSSFDIYV